MILITQGGLDLKVIPSRKPEGLEDMAIGNEKVMVFKVAHKLRCSRIDLGIAQLRRSKLFFG